MARKRPKWAKKGSKWDPERPSMIERVAREYVRKKRKAGALPKWLKDPIPRSAGPEFRIQKRLHKKRRIWAHAKLAEGCRICGRRDYEVCLDWHHIGEKNYPSCRWPHLSWELAIAEAVKCVVLCACCHRLVSFRGWDVPGSRKSSESRTPEGGRR